MSIETYTTIMIFSYTGLFLFSIIAGIVLIWDRIRKRTLRYFWTVPCVMYYSIFALFNTFVPAIAYDDLADPHYLIFQNWKLHDFILNDIKMLVEWLFIGLLLYLLFERAK